MASEVPEVRRQTKEGRKEGRMDRMMPRERTRARMILLDRSHCTPNVEFTHLELAVQNIRFVHQLGPSLQKTHPVSRTSNTGGVLDVSGHQLSPGNTEGAAFEALLRCSPARLARRAS